MSPEIEVDDDVFEVLRQNAEPFVDTPNSVLRRLLRLKDGAELSPSPARHAVRRLQAASRERSRRPTVRPPRAPRGSLLPQEEYEVPILQVLADQPEGRAPASEVIDGIEPMMRDKFKELDLETMSGGEGEVAQAGAVLPPAPGEDGADGAPRTERHVGDHR